jgi:hypothetical protein
VASVSRRRTNCCCLDVPSAPSSLKSAVTVSANEPWSKGTAMLRLRVRIRVPLQEAAVDKSAREACATRVRRGRCERMNCRVRRATVFDALSRSGAHLSAAGTGLGAHPSSGFTSLVLRKRDPAKYNTSSASMRVRERSSSTPARHLDRTNRTISEAVPRLAESAASALSRVDPLPSPRLNILAVTSEAATPYPR